MIRMEIACLLVVAFMSIMYFSAKRKNTKIHRVFSVFLGMCMLHLMLDGITVYTVNKLHSIPIWINDIFHRLFMGTMMILFYLAFYYILLLIEDDIKTHLKILGAGNIILGLGLVGAVFLPISYIETEAGNYSYGPIAYMLYIELTIFLIMILWVLLRYWKNMNVRKVNVIARAMIIELVVMVFQAIYPLSLISGMGLMLVALAFYLTIENPDIVLVEQVKEEKQKAEEANKAKSVFLSHMSHEIRTPMNAIVGMTEIMLRTDLSDEQKDYLTNIKNSGNALVAIINDILDISKIEAGKMALVEEVYEVEPVLNDIRMMIQNRIGDKPIELLYEIDSKLPEFLYGDGLRMRQIMINLLNNAVKFTEEGYVKLTIKTEPKTEEEFMLFVSVSDTGQGIREEDLEKLFGAFEQVDTKKNAGKEGTGLGLSISSQLIQMMGGKLEVRSEYGVGSEFFFQIPQKNVSGDSIKKEEIDDSMNFIAPEARILLVDDNSMNHKVALGLLAPLQLQIEVAENGKMAIDMIEKNKYHMVFMDHMMPIMDGVEATRRLRDKEEVYYKQLPIIALTANVMKEAQEHFKEVGMNGFLAKPIDVRQMSKMLRKWLPEELLIQQETDESINATMAREKDSLVQEIEEEIQLEGIDTREGIKNSGSKELFVSLLGDFYKLIDSKTLKIQKCMADNLIKDYTIEVHALKNTARMIGAMELSEKFWQLEQLGHKNELQAIKQKTAAVLELYGSYKPILKSYGTMQDVELREAPTEEIILYLQGLRDAIDEFDLDEADLAMKKLEECRLPESCQEFMENLRVYVADVAMEEILNTTEEMIAILKEQ